MEGPVDVGAHKAELESIPTLAQARDGAPTYDDESKHENTPVWAWECVYVRDNLETYN